MTHIEITGGKPLNGVIPISGAKNAALPLMVASLLSDDVVTLTNMPRLADVSLLARILSNHGADVTVSGRRPGETELTGQTMQLCARLISDTTAHHDWVSRLRAGFWVLGPLLARVGKARVALPGGCAIGARPVNLLLMAMERLGARIEIENGYAVAVAPKGLKGNTIEFPSITVGGTHIAMMAATLADGITTIKNAAREPEIVDVAKCLVKMGAKIEGAGTSTIEIDGVSRLAGVHHRVIPDRIETGTYAMCVIMTGGDVILAGASAHLLESVFTMLRRTGADITSVNDGIRVRRNGQDIQPITVNTAPFPGFPTDLQSPLLSLMTKANGRSRIVETIFENRFMHVQELVRLGADIDVEGQTATINGSSRLRGASVVATDLRASVSLIVAGLAADGVTTVNRVDYLDRGFEGLERKLAACGAMIERISDGT